MSTFVEDKLYIFRKELVDTDNPYDFSWMSKINNMPVQPTNVAFLGKVVHGRDTYYVVPKWCRPVKEGMEDKVLEMYRNKTNNILKIGS